MIETDILVIGAGAAGLMCAAIAGQRGRRVMLVDHNEAPGAKILISGGGRCNFTNLDIQPDRFLSANAHFAKSALARYKATDFIALIERHGIAYHEKTLGQLFCDGSAKQIVAMLMKEAKAGNVDCRFSVKVEDIQKPDRFLISTSQGPITADAVVLACGGLSIPKLGASDFAYRTAKRFGMKLIEPRPGLVPLTAGPADIDWMRSITGTALPCIASTGKRRFPEAMLFTHKGVSGPAILQISSYLPPSGGSITMDWLAGSGDGREWLLDAKRDRPKTSLKTLLAERLPARLATLLVEKFVEDGKLADLSDKKLLALADRLQAWPFAPDGTEGFAKAEVTLGGIDTDALSSKTMEAKKIPGLYAIGEAVDVTGWLGGYNFQWAWSSGWVAGMSA
ncbi:NAD(P)/FAD-dependent oxidoreductase [Lacibacterium aquatile]|uniref:NAD(P)/FAD-dependent oxidoreductase n=2 Tax=Lacibacterium aquatile TaxID=1168082 RepID=A0ABW5DY53_9PROT